MAGKERAYLYSFAELIDSLSINQIKEVLLPEDRESFSKLIELISKDIDTIIVEKGLVLSSRLVRLIIAISQINLHIWHSKDKMQSSPGDYLSLLKLSHQLNGIRNQMKNILLEETGDKDKSAKRTNFNTDNLEGWNISIK
mgnify:CR=1 FL=1